MLRKGSNSSFDMFSEPYKVKRVEVMDNPLSQPLTNTDKDESFELDHHANFKYDKNNLRPIKEGISEEENEDDSVSQSSKHARLKQFSKNTFGGQDSRTLMRESQQSKR